MSTGCSQCDAAQRDLALAHINHVPKETPMTTTPEPLTWTPDDGPEALLAIRDRVKAAQDANVPMEPMTAWVGGAVITDSPFIDDGDLALVVSGLYVTVYGDPRPHLTRVMWTPPADPDPAWVDADVVVAVGYIDGSGFNVQQQIGGEWFTPGHQMPQETRGLVDKYRRDGTTPVPLVRGGRVCAEAILAFGVDDHGALHDAWVHNTVGRGTWDWLPRPGRDDQ